MDPPPVVQEGVPAGPQYHYAPKNSPELIDHVGLAPWVDPGQWPCSTDDLGIENGSSGVTSPETSRPPPTAHPSSPLDSSQPPSNHAPDYSVASLNHDLDLAVPHHPHVPDSEHGGYFHDAFVQADVSDLNGHHSVAFDGSTGHPTGGVAPYGHANDGVSWPTADAENTPEYLGNSEAPIDHIALNHEPAQPRTTSYHDIDRVNQASEVTAGNFDLDNWDNLNEFQGLRQPEAPALHIPAHNMDQSFGSSAFQSSYGHLSAPLQPTLPHDNQPWGFPFTCTVCWHARPQQNQDRHFEGRCEYCRDGIVDQYPFREVKWCARGHSGLRVDFRYGAGVEDPTTCLLHRLDPSAQVSGPAPSLLINQHLLNSQPSWNMPTSSTERHFGSSQNGPVYAAATTSQSTLGDFVVQSFSLEDISRGDSEVGLPTPGTTQHRGPAQGLLSTEPLPGRPSRTPGSRRGDRSATPYSRSTRGQKPRTSAVTSSQISTPGDQSPMPPGPNTRQAFDPAEGFHPSTGYAEETSGADVEQPITGPVANGISRQPSSSAGSHVCHGYGCSKTFLTPSGLQHHAITHNPEKKSSKKCPHCPKGFRYPKDVERHVDSLHNPDKPRVTCSACGKILSRRDNLKRHVARCSAAHSSGP